MCIRDRCEAVDYNDDGIVGIADFSAYSLKYNTFVDCFGTNLNEELACLPSDYTGDGVVGIPDYAVLSQLYNQFVDCFGQSVE